MWIDGVDFPTAVETLTGERQSAATIGNRLVTRRFCNDDERERQRRAFALWREAKPLPGTLGERYFIVHRRLPIDQLGALDHALRFHPGKLVIALMTAPITGEPVGVHRIFLDADGAKHGDRKMLGRAGVVRLSGDDEVTHGLGLAEGIEKALAILLSGWAPVWAAGSAGGIGRFPVLSGVAALTIFADHDPTGTRAAQMCAARWRDAGREVVIRPPPREAA